MESNLKYFFRDNFWTTTQFLAYVCTSKWGIFALVESLEQYQLREFFFVDNFFSGKQNEWSPNCHQMKSTVNASI